MYVPSRVVRFFFFPQRRRLGRSAAVVTHRWVVRHVSFRHTEINPNRSDSSLPLPTSHPVYYYYYYLLHYYRYYYYHYWITLYRHTHTHESCSIATMYSVSHSTRAQWIARLVYCVDRRRRRPFTAVRRPSGAVAWKPALSGRRWRWRAYTAAAAAAVFL